MSRLQKGPARVKIAPASSPKRAAGKQLNGQKTDHLIKPPPSMSDAALALVERFKWDIFAVPPNTKKSYTTFETKGRNGARWGATNNPKLIAGDFTRWWRAGIGVPCGPKNGMFDIECDTPEGHNKDGIGNLKKLERKHGKLPKTLAFESPTGSVHRLYRYPNGVIIRSSASEIAEGVDIKGEGGMFVAPPTRTKKGAYRWLNRGTAIADAPQWLINLIVSKRKQNKKQADKQLRADDPDKLAAAIEVIPNNTKAFDTKAWKDFGMAIFAATGGEDFGFELFDKFSRRWIDGEYSEADTRKAWKQIEGSPPNDIGAGKIFYLANEADPSWWQRYEMEQWKKLLRRLRAKRT